MDLKYEVIACEKSSIPSSVLQLVLKIGIFFESFFVDDYIKNIKEWESKGGIGVHHTSVSKSIGELNRLGFK